VKAKFVVRDEQILRSGERAVHAVAAGFAYRLTFRLDLEYIDQGHLMQASTHKVTITRMVIGQN
jgi:hypothetical protein